MISHWCIRTGSNWWF